LRTATAPYASTARKKSFFPQQPRGQKVFVLGNIPAKQRTQKQIQILHLFLTRPQTLQEQLHPQFLQHELQHQRVGGDGFDVAVGHLKYYIGLGDGDQGGAAFNEARFVTVLEEGHGLLVVVGAGVGIPTFQEDEGYEAKAVLGTKGFPRWGTKFPAKSPSWV